MYSFDFRTQQQTNLDTGEVSKMAMPHAVLRPHIDRTQTWKDILNTVREKVAPQRSIFVMRVPNTSAGTTVKIPHPRKRGKVLPVKVPPEAVDGQLLYVPVPPPGMKKRVACLLGGVAGAATAGTVVAISTNAAAGEAVAGGAAAGAGLAGLSAPAVLGGAAVVLGTLAVAGAGVNYASRHAKKTAVVGLLAIGGLAAADHVAEVGVVDAGRDLAAAAGDLVDGAVQETSEARMRAVSAPQDAPENASAAPSHSPTADLDIDWVGHELEGDSIQEALDILVELF
jgi:hypothetical protein